MFKETPVISEPETVIGPSVKVEGDFFTEGNMIVEGVVCGSIKTAKNLRIGAKSKIFANVIADNALVAGEIQGNLKINKKLELTSSAKIFGDIKAETLIVAPGSILNGKCQMVDPKNKSPKPDFSKQEKIDLSATSDSEGETDKQKVRMASQK